MSLKKVVFMTVILFLLESVVAPPKKNTNQEASSSHYIENTEESKRDAIQKFHQVGEGVTVDYDSVNVSFKKTSEEAEAQKRGEKEAKKAKVWLRNDPYGNPIYKEERGGCWPWCK